MTNRTEIEVEIKPDGEVEITIKGIKGSGCLEIEKLIRQVLGPVKDRQLTSEYYEQPVHQTTRHEVEVKVRK